MPVEAWESVGKIVGGFGMGVLSLVGVVLVILRLRDKHTDTKLAAMQSQIEVIKEQRDISETLSYSNALDQIKAQEELHAREIERLKKLLEESRAKETSAKMEDAPPEELGEKADKPAPRPPLFDTLRVYPLRPSRSSKITYRNKVRIVLRNVSTEILYIHWATLKKGNVVIQIPPKLVLQPEKSIDSWGLDQWEENLPNKHQIYVRPGAVFSTWFGVQEYADEDEIERLHEAKELGTLVLKVDGCDEKERILV